MSKLFDLSGKVAIVTGSSRGIGRAIAEAIADAGARVVISSRTQAACDTVADGINARLGEDRAVSIPADIAVKEDVRALVAETEKRLGPVDVLVCNAAVSSHYGPTLEIPDEEFHKIINSNILSTHWLVQQVAPGMIERKAGSIVVVASLGAYLGSGTIGTYHLSKAADLQLVRNLAVELGRHSIRVNAVSPGITRTDFAKRLWEDPHGEEMLLKRTPLNRVGEATDMAGAAVFLAADASAFMTGQSMIIDGGMAIGPARS
ncbi:SDR family NAD(P)-dependent oxidoreductase [Sphingobium chungbukense]|uniref:Short-chain dehydrogenase n=1 Tax=Sphingobium chungbukense TaxID=56193 RepID=A0A0M3ASN7_9SPHN|nr:SDR family oxidoreductase [Sphingobium chungbukense]KKW91549.1 short-chain dehydrogenase [Sphingobium chungbukense]